jgi:hypothetical protein
MRKTIILLLAMAFSLAGLAQDAKDAKQNQAEDGKAQAATAPATNKKIPANSKVFLVPMGGFEEDLRAAFKAKKVPMVLVADKDQADYEITGTAESQKAGVAKKIFMRDFHSDEQASITMTDHKTGDVVFAYSVNKRSSAHGKRSTAEACAKHLKEQIEGK